MSVLSLFEEDHLRPVAVVENTLWMFSRLDGRLYSRPPDYRSHAIPEGRAAYIIPGDHRLFCITRSGGGVRVEEFVISSSDLGSRRVFQHPMQMDSGIRVTGFIRAHAGRRSVVLSTPGAGVSLVMDVETGIASSIRHDPRAALKGFAGEGSPVFAGGGRVTVGQGTAATSSEGELVDIISGGVLIRRAFRGRREFAVVDRSGSRRIAPPEGWMPIEAVFGADGSVHMTCLSPRLGYGVWRDDGDDVSLLRGTPQLFALAGGPPVLRIAGSRAGSRWMRGTREWGGSASARSAIRVDRVWIGGMPCVRLSRRRSRAVVVSFHGGPDSHEWDDLRYGGVYRTLLNRGVDVLIVNAPGSSDLGRSFHEAPWRRWREHATAAGRALRTYCDVHYRRTIALGVSFGSWFAALAADEMGAEAVVAMSPVLRLAPHLRGHAGQDAELARWATARFGVDCESAVEGDDAIIRSRTPILALVPRADEVIAKVHAVPIRLRDVSVHEVPGRHYPTTTADAEARWSALLAAIEEVLRAHPSAQSSAALSARPSGSNRYPIPGSVSR
ncbi:hypothetical protein [Leifsonia sp. C5G2]|uniref:alpha/beta hydrolase n=1 Tax=Leifsonia sp. C5G2 TaxID=2735269 RepID=UPI0015847784|nr:hypothetical protein [Leifsonia sp. C5G2]NUU08533.1 hypothetical protein [Leifsonia sp. C5G2]